MVDTPRAIVFVSRVSVRRRRRRPFLPHTHTRRTQSPPVHLTYSALFTRADTTQICRKCSRENVGQARRRNITIDEVPKVLYNVHIYPLLRAS